MPSHGTWRRQQKRLAEHMGHQPHDAQHPDEGKGAAQVGHIPVDDGGTQYTPCGAYCYCDASRRLAQRTWHTLGDWNFWVAIFTLALAVIALCTLRSADRTSEAQIALTRNNERAWVDIDIRPTEGGLTFDQNGPRLVATFRLVNGGKTIASHVMVIPRVEAFSVRPEDGGKGSIATSNHPTCDRKKNQMDVGTLVLPNSQEKFGDMPLEDMEAVGTWANVEKARKAGGRIWLGVLGCVSYFTPVADGKLHTTFFFFLIEPHPINAPYFEAVRGRTYTASQITLSRMPTTNAD